MMDFSAMPVVWANHLSILGFLVLALLVWLIPRKLIYSGAEDDARWRDIRIWASVLIALQLCLYAIFD